MKDESFHLKVLEEQDIREHFSAFQKLLCTCFPTFPSSIKDKFITQWSMERLRTVPITGAFKGDTPIGFTVISPPEGGVGTLFWLMVDHAHQGQGLGSSLLTYIETIYHAQDCHKIKLTAPTLEACQFYEKKGFTVEGFHPCHWYQMDFWSLAKQISRTL